MNKILRLFSSSMLDSLRDLAPVFLVIAFFQLLILQQPVEGLFNLLAGAFLVVLGLTFFVFGLETGLFPIGNNMAHAFARKGSTLGLLGFAFALGLGTTIAEPALIAVAEEASEIAAAGCIISNNIESMESYAFGLRLTVAVSVGLAIMLGVMRIIRGWPIQYLIIAGYILVVVVTAFAPESIIGIAYDSGAVTTSTITVPLVAALGVGLASSIKGRNPMLDGFGLIAFASLLPIIFVLLYGIAGEAGWLWQQPTCGEQQSRIVAQVIQQADGAGIIKEFLITLSQTISDVLPIIAVILFFQIFVIRKRVNHPQRLIAGFVFVLIGLALFLLGLEMALFPIGKLMAAQLTNPEFLAGGSGMVENLTWSDYYWVYLFAFMIGFSATIAEPALLAVAIKAEEISGGTISIWGLRIAVAIGAAVGISLGTYRIVTGIPLEYFIIAGYIIVVVQTWFAPRLIIPLAYDSGGVTTSTVTVPLVAALGLGLADTIPGRSVLIDGFGLIAFACLFPIISVMAYAQISEFRSKR
ncbi:MAG: DUF1538 domain-containing protein [Arenicellales bacterium]